MRKLRINVAHLIGSLGVGGAEHQVVQITNHLDASLFNRHVIVFWDNKKGFKDCLNREVKYYSLQYRRRTAPIGMFKLIRYLKRNRIDILHCHMYDPNKRGAIAGRLARVPIIVSTEHGKNLWKKWRHHFVEKEIINRIFNKRGAVSEDIRELRIKYDGVSPEDIITIPNGVVVPEYTANTRGKPKVVGSMGRLVEAKDYPNLFKSFKLVREKGYDLQLQVAGEGEEKERLNRCIHELGMSGNIILLGFQKAEKFFQQIDIFAMSSIREGIPVVLLQAMAHGLPVAVTSVGGIPEVVENEKDALLSKPGQAHEMAANIVRLIQDDELRTRLGRNSRQKILDTYCIERIAERYSRLYLHLLESIGN